MPKFNVRLSRRWDEVFVLTVEADTEEAARTQAIADAEDEEFDWDNTEEGDTEVLASSPCPVNDDFQ